MRKKHAQPKNKLERTVNPKTGRHALLSTWEPKTDDHNYFTLEIQHATLPADQIIRGHSPMALSEMIYSLVAWHNKLTPTGQHITINNLAAPKAGSVLVFTQRINRA